MNIKTAESVSPMHPDKLCDRISDAILDACIEDDPMSRVAVETMGGHGIITVTGEVTTGAYVNIRDIVQEIVGNKYGVQVNIVQQSPEISGGVNSGGAGDQGIMVGYATSETDEYIPLEVLLSRRLCQQIYEKYPYDGKTQVTLRDGKVESVVASFQNVSRADLKIEVEKFLRGVDCQDVYNVYCNPAGDWNIGGFEADTGLTGRKLAVDNYGPGIPVGGGAFSGKDPTKVDRSGAYMARAIAVDYLKRTGAREVYCYLAYAIGKKEPVQASVVIDGREDGVVGYDLSPQGIISYLDLRKPIYKQTAMWGHFGNGFLWDT